jgi:hypothetical protein
LLLGRVVLVVLTAQLQVAAEVVVLLSGSLMLSRVKSFRQLLWARVVQG